MCTYCVSSSCPFFAEAEFLCPVMTYVDFVFSVLCFMFCSEEASQV